MEKIDKLTLMAGVDIPLPSLKANIHQPTIGEIAIVGEEKFYKSIGLFNVTTESVVKALTSGIPENELERIDLVKESIGSLSDFEVLLQILNEDQEAQYQFELVLALIMPNYSLSFEERFILCVSQKGSVTITEENYPDLRDVVKTIFCLKAVQLDEFNPTDDRAKAIADKIKRAREKVRIAKGEDEEKTYILANYISGLGIGSNALNIINAVDLTVYQLFNQMERYGLYVQADYAVRASMAGAKDVEHIDWLKQI